MGSARAVPRTQRVTHGVRLALLAALLPLTSGQDYSEPPGGCSAPVDDVQPARHAAVSAERKLAAPSQEEEAAEREQRAYERELQQHTQADDEWGAIERQQLREDFWQSVLRNLAAALSMVFVAWLLCSRVRQLRGAQLGRSAPKLAGGYRAPDKADVARASGKESNGVTAADPLASTPGRPVGEQLRTSDGSPLPRGPITSQADLLRAAAASRALYEKTIATPPGSTNNLQALDTAPTTE